MGGSVSGYPFFLWLIAGVVPWFYMSDMITQGAGAIRKYSYLVTKMKFPVSTIPTFVNISKFVIHIILMLIVIIIFWLFGYPPSIYYLQLPFYMILMFIFFDAWSLFASLLASISKDFLNLVKAFVSAVFWLSGIIWDANSVTIPWLKKFLNLNPVTFFVNGFRNCFINQVWFWEQPKRFLYLGISFAIILVLALWAYKKLRKEIQKNYPSEWQLIEKRRKYIKEQLNINISDEIIPLSCSLAYLNPYLLNKGYALKIK